MVVIAAGCCEGNRWDLARVQRRWGLDGTRGEDLLASSRLARIYLQSELRFARGSPFSKIVDWNLGCLRIVRHCGRFRNFWGLRGMSGYE